MTPFLDPVSLRTTVDLKLSLIPLHVSGACFPRSQAYSLGAHRLGLHALTLETGAWVWLPASPVTASGTTDLLLI